jgi:hypothetical protein
MRAMRRLRAVSSRFGAAVGLIVGLASCGSSSTTISTSSAQMTKFASETPTQILIAAARAGQPAKSVRLSGTLQTSSVKGNFTFAFAFPSRLSATVVQGENRLQAISEPPELYLRANLAYWDSKTPQATARQYANRWLTLKGPAGAKLAKKFKNLADLYKPTNVACTLARLPHPTVVGTTTVAGQASVEVHSDGPSGHDSYNLYIATAAPHLTLRQDVTIRAAEPAPRSCPGLPAAVPLKAHVRYSDWNAVTIATPSHVTPIP